MEPSTFFLQIIYYLQRKSVKTSLCLSMYFDVADKISSVRVARNGFICFLYKKKKKKKRIVIKVGSRKV